MPEVGLAHGIAHNALARRFNVSADAVGRHAKSHMSPALRAAILTAQAPSAVDLDRLRASESEGLLSQLVHQRARLQQHVATAVDYGDVKAAISAEGAITANLQLVSRLLGMLVNVSETRTTSILISSDYLALRSALLAALWPHPAAMRDVSAALHRLESEAADTIRAAAGKLAPVTIEGTALPPATPPAVLPPLPC
jgi:hypothetical protein